MADVILTTGGTGLTGRDVTPEAIEPLFDKRIDGFAAVFHLVSYQSVGLSTMQSRATAGIIGGVFVFCLPGVERRGAATAGTRSSDRSSIAASGRATWSS